MTKFLARVHRVAGEVQAPVGADPSTGDAALRRVTHRTVDEVTKLVESHRYNVGIARIMELVSAARKTIDTGAGAGDPAVREAAEATAVMLSLFAPYTAEETWEILGHEATVAKAGWPTADPALLVQESVTCVVQVAGKVRDRLEVSPGISEDELRALALASDKVQAALDGKDVRTVIVRAPKIVNVVPV
jgi:leucyl-tRNA synthetase